MAQTKAQMTAEIARQRKQIREQYDTIMALKEKHAEDWALRLEQKVKDLEQEVQTRKASEMGAQRRYDLEREEHARTQQSRYEKSRRIRELEKLLVHNGKAMTRTGKAWKAVKEAAKG